MKTENEKSIMRDMRKLQTFWYALRHSIFPLDKYYHKIRTAPLSFSLKYFAALVFTVVAITTLAKSIHIMYAYPPEKLTFLIETIQKDYPDDLIVRIDDLGRLSTNYDKPIVVFSPLEHNPQPIIVVDAKADTQKIYEYGSRILMTERYMVIRVRDRLHMLQYEMNEPLELTKTDVLNVGMNAVIALQSYWIGLFVLAVAAILIAPVIIISTQLMTLAIISAVTFIILKFAVKRKSWTFRNIFQISLHSVTIPLLMTGFICITGLLPTFPHWYLIFNYIFLAGGIYEAYYA